MADGEKKGWSKTDSRARKMNPGSRGDLFYIDGNPIRVRKRVFINVKSKASIRYRYAMLIQQEKDNVLMFFPTMDSMQLHLAKFYQNHVPAWISELKHPVFL